MLGSRNPRGCLLGHQGAREAGGLGIAPAVLWCFDYEMSPINSCFKNFHLVVLLWKVLEPLASGVLVKEGSG